MPFNNNRNSRDDKSGKDFKKSDRSDSSSRSNSDKKSYKSSNFNKKEDSSFSGDRKPYGDKKENSSERKAPYGSRPSGNDGNYREKKPYGTRGEGSSYGEKKSYGSRNENSSSDRKPYGTRNEGSSFGEKKSYGSRNENSSNDRKPYGTRSESSYGDKKPYQGKSDFGGERKPFAKREDRNSFEDRKAYGDRKPSFKKRGDDQESRKPFVSSDKSFKPREENTEEKSFSKRPERNSFDRERKPFDDSQVKLRAKPNKPQEFKKDGDLIRLNRFISNAGICSRRKADELIIAGVVTVNGEAVSELGTKINPAKDLVRYNGELLKREKMIYVLLNKPKDYITTTDDPQERKTVMELVDKASKERIYPVGRLDRNTTGLLLLTNDGDLADKLSHPKNSISKIYNVELNRNLTQGDFNKIAFGLELEDGFIKPDDLRYVTGGAKNEIGIQIHSGKNRIVRRIFESLGYEVVKLDRVIYANLTKKDLTRGRWRYLTEQEIIQLKHFTKG